VCDKPKNSLDLESYVNLSIVNKEFQKNIIKYKPIYKILKNDINNLKNQHIYSFEVVKYQIKHIKTILPTNTNEGCLLCGNFIPNWWPKIYSAENNIYPITTEELDKWINLTKGMIAEGICGTCNKNMIMCKFCISKLNYKIAEHPRLILYKMGTLQCACCVNFRNCNWCEKPIHPLKYEDKTHYLSEYCNLECYESMTDYHFFAEMNRY
jgi:hypothetical protein